MACGHGLRPDAGVLTQSGKRKEVPLLCRRRVGVSDADQARIDALEQEAEHATPDQGFYLARATAGETAGDTAVQRDAGRKAQCGLLRCIFGNPFHQVTLDDVLLIPDTDALARAAYDERQLPSGELDLLRLAVLADALEEIGAPDELVAHLRSPGPHVRGCHAVDLILGLS